MFQVWTSKSFLQCSNQVRTFATKANTKVSVVSKSCRPIAAFSAATKGNGFVFVAGQLGLDPQTNKLVSEKVDEQAKQVLKNLKGVLEDAGSSMDKITKTTVLLTNINDFATVNKVYADFFQECGVTSGYPARAAYAVKELPLGGKVEIEAIALE